MLKIKFKRTQRGPALCWSRTGMVWCRLWTNNPGKLLSDEIFPSREAEISLWDFKQHGPNSSFCNQPLWPMSFHRAIIWPIFLILKCRGGGGGVGGVLFPASWTVAIAAVQNRTKMSPSAVAQEMQTRKWEQFWPFPWVTSIMFIAVRRLSSLIPKPTCPRLLTAVQAAPCVSASARLSTASAWFPGQHPTNQSAGCP